MSGLPVFSGKKILIAEDSPDNQILLKVYLKDQGADLIFVQNGLEALQQMQTNFVDLILMDIQMPVLDGLEATRRIRALGFQGPILALTAHALPAETKRSLEAGCNQHLTKPISRDFLLSTVRGYLTE